jgi:ADP-ribosyl-[dinitrogen reductase] hydrolase
MGEPAVSGRRDRAHFAGCLLGGAVGDALGAPVEFLSLAEIRSRFGPEGIGDFAPAYGLLGAITDDTQMSLFTAEALLRALHRIEERGIASVAGMAHRSYLRWLLTQGERPPGADGLLESGWLVGLPALRARRAPGNTCLAALRSGRLGTPFEPINESKGCGGVMRAAPVGLVMDDPFGVGCEVAAVTHGHPSGYLAAGHLAAVVGGLVAGASLDEAIAAATAQLAQQEEAGECLAAVQAAVALAEMGPSGAAEVERLGEGWVAEEALAIGLYAALVARAEPTPGASFERGVRLAVNHGGDSDSTGAIAGNLLGTLYGVEAVPPRWLDRLELRAEIATVADDLYRRFVDPGAVGFDELVEEAGALRVGGNPAHRGRSADLGRYPPW